MTARPKCSNLMHTIFYTNHYTTAPNDLFFAPDSQRNKTNICKHFTEKQFNNSTNRCVDYIIDKENSELPDCDKDIVGNMILANCEWKKQAEQLCWKYLKTEKMQVYKNIFTKALENVKYCCGTSVKEPVVEHVIQPTIEPTNAPVLTKNAMMYIISGVVFSIILCITVICWFLKPKEINAYSNINN